MAAGAALGIKLAADALSKSFKLATKAIDDYSSYLKKATSQIYQLNKVSKDLYKNTILLAKRDNINKNLSLSLEKNISEIAAPLIKIANSLKSTLTDFNYIAKTTNELRKAATSQTFVQYGFSGSTAEDMADNLKDITAKAVMEKYLTTSETNLSTKNLIYSNGYKNKFYNSPYESMAELYASEEFETMYKKFEDAIVKGGAIEGTYFNTEYAEGKALKEGRIISGVDYTEEALMKLRYEDLINQMKTYEAGGVDKLSELLKEQRNSQRIFEHMEGSLYSFDEVITADAFSNADSIDDVNISMNKGLTEAAKQRQEEIDATNKEATLLESKLGDLILDAENNGLTLYQLLEKTDFGGVKGLLEGIGQYINDFKGEYIKNTPKQGIVVTDPRTGVKFTPTKEFVDNEFEKLYKNFQYYQKTGRLGSTTTSDTPATSFNGNMSSVTDVLYNNFGSAMSQIDNANNNAATLLNPGSVNVTINNRGLNFASEKEWEDSAYKLGTYLKNLDNKTGVFGYGSD